MRNMHKKTIKKGANVWSWNGTEWKRAKILTVDRRYCLTVKYRDGSIARTGFRVVADSTKPAMDYEDYIGDKVANSLWGYGMTMSQKSAYRLLQKLGIKPR